MSTTESEVMSQNMQGSADISEAQARANDESIYNDKWIENMRIERARAADSFDNYSQAASLARERMEACDAAMGSYESNRTQPALAPR